MKQYNLGQFIGAIKTQMSRIQFYYSIIIIMLAAIAARPQLLEWFPWLSFPLFIVFILVLLVIAGIVDHVFMIQAELTYQAQQSFRADNPSAHHLKEIKSDIKKIKTVLGIDND